MRRYNVHDISEQHYRALRLLLALEQAEAYIVVRSKRAWPPTIFYSPHQRENQIPGDAIN